MYIEIVQNKNIYYLFKYLFLKTAIKSANMNVKIENNESINCELFCDFLKCLLIISDARNLVVD